VLGARFGGRTFEEPPAALCLAPRLDTQRRDFEKTQPGSVERRRIALPEQQSDLVDRLGVLAFGARIWPSSIVPTISVDSLGSRMKRVWRMTVVNRALNSASPTASSK
jgi:hypothetical protein